MARARVRVGVKDFPVSSTRNGHSRRARDWHSALFSFFSRCPGLQELLNDGFYREQALVSNRVVVSLGSCSEID